MQNSKYSRWILRLALIGTVTSNGPLAITLAQQQLLENFEENLDQWTVINGEISISNAQAHDGKSALRMSGNIDTANRSIVEFNGLDDNFGTYEIWFYCTGNSSTADILIQYIDENNFLRISCRPLGTINSGIQLSQSTPAGERIVDAAPAIFNLNQWNQLSIDRFCDGHIHVDVNGVRALSLDIFRDYHRGKVQLQAQSSATFFDDLSFRPFQPPPLLARVDTTCAGIPVRIGGALRYTSGTYHEVTSVIEDNCVAEHEVNLHVIEVDTVNEAYTLCLGDTVFSHDRFFTQAGSYQVTAVVPEGCGDLTEIEIDHYPRKATIDSFEFCPIPGNEISPGAFTDYRWANGSSAAQIMPDEEGIYPVSVRDEYACLYNLELHVSDICPIATWVPNAFSPNGDGINDFLTSHHNKQIDFFHLTIFDRWGNQVFETTNREGWSGKMGSENAPQGVYIYLLKVNEETVTGEVTLIR